MALLLSNKIVEEVVEGEPVKVAVAKVPGADHRDRIRRLLAVDGEFHKGGATTERIASRLGGLAHSYVEKLLESMPEIGRGRGGWTVDTRWATRRGCMAASWWPIFEPNNTMETTV